MSTDSGGAVSSYFLSLRGEVYGPLPIEEITRRILDGRITPREWIFLAEAGEWYPVIEIPQLASCFYSASEKPSAPPAGSTGAPAGPGTTRAHLGSETVEFGKQGVDKRRWVRLPTTLSIRFALDSMAEDSQQTYEAVTVDLSEGGLGFHWPQEIPLGTFVRVELDIFPHLLKTKGRVTRCLPHGDSEFDIGVLFVTLSDNDRKNLKEFIRTAATLGG